MPNTAAHWDHSPPPRRRQACRGKGSLLDVTIRQVLLSWIRCVSCDAASLRQVCGSVFLRTTGVSMSCRTILSADVRYNVISTRVDHSGTCRPSSSQSAIVMGARILSWSCVAVGSALDGCLQLDAVCAAEPHQLPENCRYCEGRPQAGRRCCCHGHAARACCHLPHAVNQQFFCRKSVRNCIACPAPPP